MDESAPASLKPSQIPSWVMVGFVLGALFVIVLPPRRLTQAPPAPPPRPAPVAPAPPRKLQLTTVESVFEVWQKYAVWDNDRTEIALWNSDDKAYSDCYEVVRMGDVFYYRSIPRLTRPVLTHGLSDDPNPPLLFTETEAQRQVWLQATHADNWRIINSMLNGGNGNGPKP